MVQHKRGVRFSKENLGRLLFLFSIFFLLSLSLLLTLSPAVKYRRWDVDYPWSHWIGFFTWIFCTILTYKTANIALQNWDKILFFCDPAFMRLGNNHNLALIPFLRIAPNHLFFDLFNDSHPGLTKPNDS